MVSEEELRINPRSKLELWLEKHDDAPEVLFRGVRGDFIGFLKKEPVWVSMGLRLEKGRQEDSFAESVKDLVTIMAYGRQFMEKIRRIGPQLTKEDPVLKRIEGRLKKAGVSNASACLDLLPDAAEELYRALFSKAQFNRFVNPTGSQRII